MKFLRRYRTPPCWGFLSLPAGTPKAASSRALSSRAPQEVPGAPQTPPSRLTPLLSPAAPPLPISLWPPLEAQAQTQPPPGPSPPLRATTRIQPPRGCPGCHTVPLGSSPGASLSGPQKHKPHRITPASHPSQLLSALGLRSSSRPWENFPPPKCPASSPTGSSLNQRPSKPRGTPTGLPTSA